MNLLNITFYVKKIKCKKRGKEGTHSKLTFTKAKINNFLFSFFKFVFFKHKMQYMVRVVHFMFEKKFKKENHQKGDGKKTSK